MYHLEPRLASALLIIKDSMIVYKATAPNNKCYIGITSKSLEERKKEHKQKLSKAKIGKKFGKRDNVYKTRPTFVVYNKYTEEEIGRWDNASECARFLGTFPACISRCLKYPHKFKSYKQYKFKYCE